MTPTYWDNAIYTIKGDLIELRRHVSGLLDDLAFCTRHEAVRAIEHFDEEAHAATEGLMRASLDRLRNAKRQIGLHPQTLVLVSCLAGTLAGFVVFRALGPARRHG